VAHVINLTVPGDEHHEPVEELDGYQLAIEQALADVIAELVDSVITSEPVDRLIEDPTDETWGWRRERTQHVVHHPSLLEQLGRAVEGSSQLEGEAVRGTPGSRPSARLDALAVTQRIDLECTTWSLRLGLDARVPIFSRLCRLVDRAVEGEQERDDRGRTLLQAARSWRAAARVTTGWDSRPMAPRVPCPEPSCEEVATLRIRIDVDVVDGIAHTTGGAASCLACGAAWDEDLVLGLYEYTRWAIEHELHTAVRPVTPAVLQPDGTVLRPAVEAEHQVLVHVLDDDGALVFERGRALQQLVTCPDCVRAREEMADNRRARAAAAAAHVAAGELMPVQAVEGAVHDDVVAAATRRQAATT